jgi:hypothetical protein
VFPVAIATTGAEHVPDAFITQNDGYPRAPHDENDVLAAVVAASTGAIQVPAAVIDHAAGKPIALHDENVLTAFVAAVTAIAIVDALVHASVAVPPK